MSGVGLGCVKTRNSRECVELFAQLPSDRCYQWNWFDIDEIEKEISTRKSSVRVFTQPRSKTDLEPGMLDVSFPQPVEEPSTASGGSEKAPA